MELVKVTDIPKGLETPKDNLPALYKTFLELQLLCEKEGGIGLSAVQVGLPWKFFVVKEPDGVYRCFVNCKYKWAPETKKIPWQEGCLSLRNPDGTFKLYDTNRFKSVSVEGEELVAVDKPQLVPFRERFTDLYSVVFQHEIDHQDGILISTHGQEMSI